MSRQLEQGEEDRASRMDAAVLQAVNGGLVDALSRAGAELQGFSYKNRGYDHLIVLRVTLAGRAQVCFVGGDSLGSCLVKAVRTAHSDKLNFRADKYGT